MAARKLAPHQSVLIVDPSEDTRQVLRTVLARRGVQIWESDEGTAGLQLAREHHPDVIVFDTDADNSARELWAEYADQAKIDETSLVVLGTARRSQAAASEFVAKPYQYGPLVHKIEALLDEVVSARRRAG
jgi:CheY-like chemotaxis protein